MANMLAGVEGKVVTGAKMLSATVTLPTTLKEKDLEHSLSPSMFVGRPPPN